MCLRVEMPSNSAFGESKGVGNVVSASIGRQEEGRNIGERRIIDGSGLVFEKMEEREATEEEGEAPEGIGS